MHASQIDFVTALSSEEQCPVCAELHASVDQSVCSVCATTMCPDCASLRPDASWICSRCVSVAPARAVRARARFSSLRGARLGSLELARQTYLELQRGSRRTGARVAVLFASLFALCALLRVRGFAALRVVLTALTRTVTRLTQAAHGRTHALAATLRPRLLATSSALAARASRLYARYDMLHHQYGARARAQLGAWLLSIRNIDLREQLSGMLIATALLVAVARSEHRHNSR